MPNYSLSNDADADVADIARYTLAKFGERQVIKYIATLERTFQLLADFPKMGLVTDELRPGLHRFPNQSHMIFYTIAVDHILIVRVLHARADFPNLI
jgi:toxin ParE1/3/4